MGGQLGGESYDLVAVIGAGGDGGVPAGVELLAFADALNARSEALDSARDALRAVLGDAGVMAAAGVVSNFYRMNRIADATGIPLDGMAMALSTEVRAELQLDAWADNR